MVDTPYHEYSQPDRGTENWDKPINANFAALDTDVELRDSGTPGSNNYDPKVGAKYLDTASGVVYVGESGANGPEWTASFALARYDANADEVTFSSALGVGTLTGSVTGGTAVSNLAGTGLSIASGSLGLANDSLRVAGNSVSLGGSTDVDYVDLEDTGSSFPVPNADLANSSVTITAGTGLAGGGTTSLGNSTTLSIASSGVGTSELASGAVTKGTIDIAAVGGEEIGADAVNSGEIAADAVGTSELATPFADLATLVGDPVSVGGTLQSAGALTVNTGGSNRTLELGTPTLVDNGTTIGGNVLAGSPNNTINAGATGVVIAGGGGSAFSANTVYDRYGVIGGGEQNQAGTVDGDSTTALHATVGGGFGNTASGPQSTVCGGDSNTASGQSATVPGGSGNTASGQYSMAVGQNGTANNDGALLFADSSPTELASDGADQARFQMPVYLPALNGGVTGNNEVSTLTGTGLAVSGGSLAVSGVPNSALTNSSVTVTAGDGLQNGGSVSLGSSTALDVEPSDFAGTALEGDGSDNLAVSSGGIGTSELASGAVTKDTIDIAAVGGEEIGADAVNSGEIAASAVGTSELATPFADLATLFGDPISTGGTLQSAGALTVNTDGANGGRRALELGVPGADGFGNTGGGNVLAGHPNNAIGDGALAAVIGGGGGGATDLANTVTDNYSVVGGGFGNRAGDDDGDPVSAFAATVAGGRRNTASGNTSTVGGGFDNTASGQESTVGGGSGNTASGNTSTVGGGRGNEASDSTATVAGGGGNTADFQGATVGGGGGNTASADDTTVAGGTNNTAETSKATISGGENNTASGFDTAIGGGLDNTASSNKATVAGGGENTASGSLSTVSGGNTNAATETGSAVGGGYFNKVRAKYGTIAGGGPSDPSSNPDTTNNVVYDNYGTIAGGGNNQAGTDDGDPQDPTNATYATVSGGQSNTAQAVYATVGGGLENTASDSGATVGGGRNNTASGSDATVGGGFGNTASDSNATVGGGIDNTASGSDAVVSGGRNNTASELRATVGGGLDNTASDSRATVGGGLGNTASGSNATVPGGENGAAESNESFVWNDGSGYHDIPNDNNDGLSSNTAVDGESVTGANTFSVSATGGVRFITGSASNPSVTYIPNDSAGWTTTSSRAVKTNINPVDPEDALTGVEELEVATWEYESEDGKGTGTTHIGPMAGDFHDAFDVGSSDEHINSINADGVALAAIQGLSQELEETRAKLEQRDERIDDLERENEQLQNRLAAIEGHLGLAGDEPAQGVADD